MLFLITPTGGRPEGMAFLTEYLNAQTYNLHAHWIIVDDVDPATPWHTTRFHTTILRPHWRWQRGENTQSKSMAAALEQVGDDDTVIVLEDDDVYLYDHIITTLRELETCELVGERVSRYYNVATRRYQEIPGKVHASLSSNGVRGEALKLLRQICASGSRRIDMDLWRGFRGQKRMTDHANVIGIKGLPGRAGIGIGHKEGFGLPDTDGVLHKWLGHYADRYQGFET